MKPPITRLWLGLLGLLMLLALSIVAAKSPAAAQEAVAQPGAGAKEEVIEMRARNHKVFKYTEVPRIVNGNEIERRTMQVSVASLHYQDANGLWQDVDITPVDAGSEYRVDKTNAPVRLPKAGSDPLVIKAGNETITVRLEGARPSTSVRQDSRVQFSDILPQTDIAYAAEPDGVREFITLKAAGHPSTFTFHVTTPLAMSLEEGEVVFRNGAGEAVGSLARPWLTVPGSPPTTRWGNLSLDGNRVTMRLAGPQRPSLPYHG